MRIFYGKNEFRLTPSENFRDRLPKRYAKSATVSVNGEKIETRVTENKGFAGAAPSLVYPFFLLDGRAYYATLRPEELDEFLGAKLRTDSAIAARPNPERETSRVAAEAARIAAFRATYAANRTSVPALPAPVEAPLAETETASL